MGRKNVAFPEEELQTVDDNLKAHMYISIDDTQEEKLFLDYFLKDNIVEGCYSNYSSGYDYVLSLNPQNTTVLDSFCFQLQLLLPSLKSTTMIYGGRQLK